ncbi:MAG TPA: hypothetical protein VFA46_00655 [Actinomycetes bacterium]|jgi:hypothetical protein|nr:hypothetical protein [Actinomycetes bacterium]
MYRGRDRDDNGIPDWQEDENYLDEAPSNAPVGTGGCLVASMPLLAGAAVAGAAVASRVQTRRRGSGGARGG